MGTRTHQIEFEGDDREAVATAVRDGIGEELVEGDHADDLVREVAELVVETATEGDYAEAFVEETLDEGLAIIVEEDGVVRIVDRGREPHNNDHCI